MNIQEVVLDQAEAALREKPSVDARVLGQAKKNEPLVVLEIVSPSESEPGPGWCRVRHGTLGEGYVAGNTKIRPADVPELTYGRCFMGGAKIITGVAAIGAVFLAISGEYLGAISLLVTCFVTGGLAGLVYFATTDLRERAFGAYLSWLLVCATYFISVGVVLYLLSVLAGAAAPFKEQTLAEPLFASFMIGACLLLAFVLGYQEERVRHQEDGRPWRLAQVAVPLLASVAGWMLLVGGLWWWSLEKQRPLVEEASTPAQKITLRQLIDKGYGENRYLLLTECRHADQWIVEEAPMQGDRRNVTGWAILVPGKVDKNFIEAKSARTPARIHAVLRRSEFVDASKSLTPGIQRLERSVLDFFVREQSGFKAMVMNGVQGLPASARQAILELAPQTDLDRVWILSTSVEPLDGGAWQERWQMWLFIALGGLILLAIAVWWGRRASVR